MIGLLHVEKIEICIYEQPLSRLLNIDGHFAHVQSHIATWPACWEVRTLCADYVEPWTCRVSREPERVKRASGKSAERKDECGRCFAPSCGCARAVPVPARATICSPPHTGALSREPVLTPTPPTPLLCTRFSFLCPSGQPSMPP